jgi:hypothetical protein
MEAIETGISIISSEPNTLASRVLDDAFHFMD